MIEVVLPTFNGVLYLEDQIDSIWRQTLRPNRLIINDDCSTDGTQNLIYKMSRKYGSWISYQFSEVRLGLTQNINILLARCTENYIAFADQDDVWLPSKLERSYSLMNQLEHHNGINTPLLVYSDLQLIDADGISLGTTYYRNEAINPHQSSVEILTHTNVVVGCTMLINRDLLIKAYPIPCESTMHDHWLAIVGSFFGRIHFLDYATVKYRQHSANTIGSSGSNRFLYWSKKLIQFFLEYSSIKSLKVQIRQAEYFKTRYGHAISRIPFFSNLNFWMKLVFLFKNLVSNKLPYKHNALRTLAFYLGLLTLRRD